MVAERGDPGPKDLGKDLDWMFSPRPASERRLTDWTRDVPRRARSSWADGQPCGFLDVGGSMRQLGVGWMVCCDTASVRHGGQRRHRRGVVDGWRGQGYVKDLDSNLLSDS
jgi:hypothetical protein